MLHEYTETSENRFFRDKFENAISIHKIVCNRAVSEYAYKFFEKMSSSFGFDALVASPALLAIL